MEVKLNGSRRKSVIYAPSRPLVNTGLTLIVITAVFVNISIAKELTAPLIGDTRWSDSPQLAY
ncbi:MAG: hypothetical protein ACI9VI_002479 [Candidatus Azotimanducaceae bacterium]|jgi:hypothetical protein